MSIFRNLGERLREGLERTRRSLRDGLESLLTGGELDPALLADLESLLIGADLGPRLTEEFIERLNAEVKRDRGLDAAPPPAPPWPPRPSCPPRWGR